ncbi:hypothetical protein FOCC_FOCC017432, partial [Frankliniella occidentalis]
MSVQDLEKNRLSVEEIRQLPRFASYEEGSPSAVRDRTALSPQLRLKVLSYSSSFTGAVREEPGRRRDGGRPGRGVRVLPRGWRSQPHPAPVWRPHAGAGLRHFHNI